MKKLLSTLSVAIIGASSGSLLTNSLDINQQQDNATFANEFFWNSNNTAEVKQIRTKGHGLWTKNPQLLKALYTFNLGAQADFNTFSFLDGPPLSRVDWGNSHMGQWFQPQSFALVFDEEHNKQISSIDDVQFVPSVKIKVFDEIFNAVFATLVVRTYLGYTWYTANDEYYLQFLLFEYIDVRSDFSEAFNEINLGRGFALSKS